MGVVAIYHVRTINEPYLPKKRLRYYAKSPLSIKLDPSLTLSPETSVELDHLLPTSRNVYRVRPPLTHQILLKVIWEFASVLQVTCEFLSVLQVTWEFLSGPINHTHSIWTCNKISGLYKLFSTLHIDWKKITHLLPLALLLVPCTRNNTDDKISWYFQV